MFLTNQQQQAFDNSDISDLDQELSLSVTVKPPHVKAQKV